MVHTGLIFIKIGASCRCGLFEKKLPPKINCVGNSGEWHTKNCPLENWPLESRVLKQWLHWLHVYCLKMNPNGSHVVWLFALVSRLVFLKQAKLCRTLQSIVGRPCGISFNHYLFFHTLNCFNGFWLFSVKPLFVCLDFVVVLNDTSGIQCK